MDTWEDERLLRIKYESRSSSSAFNTIIKEFKSEGKFKIKDLKVSYFEVDHKPVKYAYGFNFFNKNKKLTISGDTKPCENLIKHAQKADVLLHEVYISEEMGHIRYSKMRSKQTLHNVKSYHTSSEQVGKIAKISRCKKLVLTHFVPTIFNESNLKT